MVDCPDDAKFQGEKQDLEEMLGNLLDNACKWSSGRVYLTVTTPDGKAREGWRRLAISVEDDGPGLTAEQRTKIGKRGMRLDETKPGSGLGLSIVADLAHSYRGSVQLAASTHGGLAVNLDCLRCRGKAGGGGIAIIWLQLLKYGTTWTELLP